MSAVCLDMMLPSAFDTSPFMRDGKTHSLVHTGQVTRGKEKLCPHALYPRLCKTCDSTKGTFVETKVDIFPASFTKICSTMPTFIVVVLGPFH